MAGVLGFEPRDAGTKNRCLTAWLYPNVLGTTYQKSLKNQDVWNVNGILRSFNDSIEENILFPKPK